MFKAEMLPSEVSQHLNPSNIPLTIVIIAHEQTAHKSYKPALHEASWSL